MTTKAISTGKGKDITGKRFGQLVALRRTEKLCKHQCRIWACKCVCGREVERSTRQLTSYTKNCGCGRTGQGTIINRQLIELNNQWLARPLMTKENTSPAEIIIAAQQKAAAAIAKALQTFHKETGLIPERVDFSAVDARNISDDPSKKSIVITLVEVSAKTC